MFNCLRVKSFRKEYLQTIYSLALLFYKLSERVEYLVKCERRSTARRRQTDGEATEKGAMFTSSFFLCRKLGYMSTALLLSPSRLE